jgi:hypothetical protein
MPERTWPLSPNDAMIDSGECETDGRDAVGCIAVVVRPLGPTGFTTRSLESHAIAGPSPRQG